MDAGDMEREALKQMLGKVELRADAKLDLEKERVRAEIAKLQAEHAKLKAEEQVQRMMQSAPQRVAGGQSATTFGTEVCFWCDKQFSIFALMIDETIVNPDGRSYCSSACMIAQTAFDHQELQAGLDYVKRSLGTDEEIA